jgi:hypothetical protein
MSFARDTGLPFLFGAGDIVAKAARTVNGDSGWVDLGDVKELIAQLDADAGTGTSPTLDVRFQTSWNGSDATAIDAPSGAFTQVTSAASAQIKSLTVMHRYAKVMWTISGTSPSFNFGVYLTARK